MSWQNCMNMVRQFVSLVGHYIYNREQSSYSAKQLINLSSGMARPVGDVTNLPALDQMVHLNYKCKTILFE